MTQEHPYHSSLFPHSALLTYHVLHNPQLTNPTDEVLNSAIRAENSLFGRIAIDSIHHFMDRLCMHELGRTRNELPSGDDRVVISDLLSAPNTRITQAGYPK